MLFYKQKRKALTAPTKMNLLYLHLPRQGGGESTHSPGISLTLVQLFKNNIMITLATDPVQQFYAHQLVHI
jgi:hypothetical protein